MYDQYMQIQEEYEVGDYIDYNSSVSWVPRIIDSTLVLNNDIYFKIKDPRYTSLHFENVISKSPKIKPYKSMVPYKSSSSFVSQTQKWKKINVEALKSRQAELQRFILSMDKKNPKQIIQYLRGRHYYFGEELVNTQLQEKSHYEAVMKYFATHRRLLIKYIGTVCFDMTSNNIYYNGMSALCSCFPELMEFTNYAVGLASEFQVYRKEYPHWHDQSAFQSSIQFWVEEQLYPALMESEHMEFPPNFIFNIFSLLGSLFSRLIPEIHSTPQIYKMLYDDLKRSLYSDIYTPREFSNFMQNCQTYFKQFVLSQNDNDNDIMSQSSQTQQLQMIDEDEDEDQFECRPSYKKKPVKLTKAEMITQKKMQFSLHLLKVYISRKEHQKFLKEFAAIVTDMNTKHMQHTYNTKAWWPNELKYFTQQISKNKFLDTTLDLKVAPSQTSYQRSIILKLYPLFPNQILHQLIEKEKLIILKHLIQPQAKLPFNFQAMASMIDRIVEKSSRSPNVKEYLQFLSYLEKMLKAIFPHQNLKYLRKKIIQCIFSLASCLNKEDHGTYIDTLLDFSDQLREQIWLSYTQSQIIPKANTQYSYFNELSIQKYFQKFKIDIQSFENICKFMIEQDIREQKYQKRKASVIHSLNYQYRYNQQNYLEYLGIFLNYFCHPAHDKDQKDWVNLLPFANDQKYPPFISLPITQEFCKTYLPKLSPLYYQTDIHIFCKLMLKLNILNRRVIHSQQNDSVKVIEFPQYLNQLLTSLYASLSGPRVKLIEREVQKYFYGAQYNDEIYNRMLMVFLQVIVNNEAKRSEVNVMFKKFKSKHFLIPKQTSINTLKNDEHMVFRNRKAWKKYQSLLLLQEKDKYLEPMVQDYKSKASCQLLINRVDLIKHIRYRLAFKLNRQPSDIIFLIEDRPLDQDKLNLSFQEVYFQQFYSENKAKENTAIDYEFSIVPTLIREEIINRFPGFYSKLPNTLSIIKGLDLIDQNWSGNFSLEFIHSIFKSKLNQGNFSQEDLKISSRLQLILDFYIWNLEDREKYNYVPLLRFLSKNENNETVLKNYKIIYLLSQSNKIELTHVDCDQLMMCLLPDPSMSKEKMDRSISVKSTKQYELLEQLVVSLIENHCKGNLQFMASCNYFSQFGLYEQYYPTYSKLWTKIYTNATLQQKQAFFQSIEQTIISYPDNMRDFYTIIDYDQLKNNTEFYQQKIGQLTYILLKLNKQNLTLTQMKTSEILITNICQLTDEERIFHPLLHSKEIVQFIKNNLYNLSEKAQRQLFNIMKIVVSNQENRLHLLQFFERQTRQKQWIVKPFLMKSAPKSLQAQGRVGLRNPHSVCYANSFLQQLYHIQLFRDELFDTHFTQHQNQQQDLIYQLKKIFVNLHFGRESYINMNFFRAFKNMDGEQTNIEVQMDVDQFRNLLLDRIQKGIPSNNNFVKKLFNGKQKSIIKSQECQHQSKRQQQFSSLCVQVKDVNNLQASLNNYFKPQILNNDNAYYCDQCKKKVTAQKTIEISQLPPYLTFVLKRFQYVAYSRSKVNSYFQFPLKQLQYFQGVKYTLKGVIVHMGVSQAGHYISYAKHKGVWYQFNDCNIDEVDENRLRQYCFGNSSKGWSLSQSKNAYLLIYESSTLPPKQEVEAIDRSFYGITDQYKKIVRNRILTTKQRVYFSQNFLQTLNYIADRFGDSHSLHLLFWTLMVIHLRIKNEYVKHDALYKSFMILKKNKNEFKYLWYQQMDRVKEIFTSQMAPEYKSVLIEILAQNCDQYNERVEKMLEICLRKIYQQKIDHSGYYIFMHVMAKKFDEACYYLNSQRIVGRIFDILHMGVIGEKIRQNLKKTCEVEFEEGSTMPKNLRETTRAYFKYHKWALVTYILEKTNMQLHELQKQHYVFQISNITLSSIFMEATQKPIIKYISKFFALIIKNNKQSFNKLSQYISDQIREKGDFKKHMKILKEILFENEDDQSEQRNRVVVTIFQRFLRKLQDDKREYSFLYAWQWFCSINRTNRFFRTKVRQHRGMFEYLATLTPYSLGIYRNRLADGRYKFEQTKHPLYGIIAPTTINEAQELISNVINETEDYLCKQIETHGPADEDGDIVGIKVEEGLQLLKYDETLLKFHEVVVFFTFGDLILLFDKHQKSKDFSYGVCFKGDQNLRLRTESFPKTLIKQVSQKSSQPRNSN